MLTRTTLTFNIAPISLLWTGDDLKDWAGNGRVFCLNGEVKGVSTGRIYRFDAAIQSNDGIYTVVYEKFGTKGVILRNGDVLREICRSYYFAESYEYPVALVNIDNAWAIVHCPNEYNRIEVDDLESGKRLTKTENRAEPVDCFHSRFRVNDSGTFILNTGWVWHPMDILEVFDVEAALNNNNLFDELASTATASMVDVCSAEFLTDDLLVISIFKDESPPVYQLGLFSISSDRFVKKVDVEFPLGTLVPIDEDYVVDLQSHPKLINLNTGNIEQEFPEIHSGFQNSSRKSEDLPPIAIDRLNNRIAIGNGMNIEILEFGR